MMLLQTLELYFLVTHYLFWDTEISEHMAEAVSDIM